MTDPSTGPIPREKFAELVNAPFGEASKAIRQHDPQWGRAPGAKFQWLVHVERSGSDQGRAWVDAASQEEAEQLAANLSTFDVDWEYDGDRFMVVSVEPDKR